MPCSCPSYQVALAVVKHRASLNLALEEAVVTVLSDHLFDTRDALSQKEVEEAEHAIRSHRIGIMKQRAAIGAFGIDA